MLDIKYIIQNPSLVLKSIKKRNIEANLEVLSDNYKYFKELSGKLDKLREEANYLAYQISTSSSKDKETYIKLGAITKIKIKKLEKELSKTKDIYRSSLLTIPNILAPDTPPGEDDSKNVVIREFLSPTQFDFVPKDHIILGRELDLIDFDAGSKISGSKFYFLKNEAVLLEMALKQFVFAKVLGQGFTLMQTPELVKKEIILASGYSPKGKESNAYQIEDHDLNLIATSEVAIGGYHSGELLDEKKLPIKYAAESHCFRTEAGGAGRNSKGLYRVHQFSKIELYAFSKPENSNQILEEILSLEESIYQDLRIPYRVLRICAGDLGAPAYKKYDIEAWMPGKDEGGAYGEVTSASNCTDFQARRLNIKYRNSINRKNELVHTINGTAIALSRTLIAILENYQTSTGEIIIPNALRPFMNLEKISRNKKPRTNKIVSHSGFNRMRPTILKREEF